MLPAGGRDQVERGGLFRGGRLFLEAARLGPFRGGAGGGARGAEPGGNEPGATGAAPRPATSGRRRSLARTRSFPDLPPTSHPRGRVLHLRTGTLRVAYRRAVRSRSAGARRLRHRNTLRSNRLASTRRRGRNRSCCASVRGTGSRVPGGTPPRWSSTSFRGRSPSGDYAGKRRRLRLPRRPIRSSPPMSSEQGATLFMKVDGWLDYVIAGPVTAERPRMRFGYADTPLGQVHYREAGRRPGNRAAPREPDLGEDLRAKLVLPRPTRQGDSSRYPGLRRVRAAAPNPPRSRNTPSV